MDRGHEDRARTDPVELVHDLVRLVAAHHDADRSPLLVVERGDRRRLEPWRHGDGAVDELERYVVVHEDVLTSGEDALEATREDVDARRGLVARAPDEDGLGTQDRFPEHLEA